MTIDDHHLFEAADTLFFEAEAPDGFLVSLESQRVFDDAHWQRLWEAVASLIAVHNGDLDTWTNYDLMRIIDSVQAEGVKLTGRNYQQLNDFELQILEANVFIRDTFAAE